MYGNVEAASFLVSFLIAYPLGALVDRFHPLRMGIITMSLYIGSCTFGVLFIRDQSTFLPAFMAHTIISGMYFTSTAALAAMLFPKVTFAQFTAAAAVLAHLGSITLSVVQGAILDFSGSNYSLVWIMGGVLCLGSTACLIVVYRRFLALGGMKGYAPPLSIPKPD
jgi:MFS family permease